jgi:hypothetical protein
MPNRFDETWHRLREWTQGQTPSERLGAQILINEGFADVDPSHPLGGKDGGKDAIAKKNGKRFAMAVYFPRGQQQLGKITEKFEGDLAGARTNSAEGFACACYFARMRSGEPSPSSEQYTYFAPIRLERFRRFPVAARTECPICSPDAGARAA